MPSGSGNDILNLLPGDQTESVGLRHLPEPMRQESQNSMPIVSDTTRRARPAAVQKSKASASTVCLYLLRWMENGSDIVKDTDQGGPVRYAE